METKSFLRSVIDLAVPAALQSMLQASFSTVDQIMIGQLGEGPVAAVGLAGKFVSIHTVLNAAFAAVAGILIAQYLGRRDGAEARRCLKVGFLAAAGVALLFQLLCFAWPEEILCLYTRDMAAAALGAAYLQVVSWTFLPAAGTVVLSTMLRCMERAKAPLWAGFVAAAVNTALNAVLIFGLGGFPALGVRGAALATLAAQLVNLLLIVLLYIRYRNRDLPAGDRASGPFPWRIWLGALIPVVICEGMWSLGENVYGVIYGRLGTAPCAAMTLTGPVQSLMIGALCGLSQAAGVLVGGCLGRGEREEACRASWKLLGYGAAGSLLLSGLLLLIAPWYVQLFDVAPEVQAATVRILQVYALIAPFKVQNMIVGGGILRSGGKTHLVMVIDLIGTWIFGVPMGLLSAFVFHLAIWKVYLLLSLEECVRFAISLVVLHSRKWMQTVPAGTGAEQGEITS